jgi:hypothetical protein
VSRSIARRHNGDLTLDMEAPTMCFRLVLPRKADARRGRSPAAPAETEVA